MKIKFLGGPLKKYIEDISQAKLSPTMALRFYDKLITYRRSTYDSTVYHWVKTERVSV